MSFTYDTNCSRGAEFYNCQPLRADPDITGTGVVTNFFATAYITWTLFLLNYVFAYDPSTPTARFTDGTDRPGSHATWRPNPIDLHTIAWIRRVTRIKTRHPRVAQIFDECILSMCDLQIMTGFALLSCGFILAFSVSEPLSSYHWFLIVCLAWFSAITHLAGLSILRTYFDGRPRVKAARIVLMFLLLVTLIVALIPTGFFNWRQLAFGRSAAARQSPAICFFDISNSMSLWSQAPENADESYIDGHKQEVTESVAMQQMVLTVILLVLGFASRCIKLFRPLTQTVRRGIRRPAHDCFAFMIEKLVVLLLRRPSKTISLARVANHGSFWDRFWIFTVFTPLFGCFLTGRFFGDLISSMLAEIIWVLVALIWGTNKYFSLHLDGFIGWGCDDYPLQGDDQRWTFGQIMAVALLASPIFSLVWKFSELAIHMKNSTTEQRRQSSSPTIEPGINATNGAQLLPETQHGDRQAATVQPGLLNDNAVTDSVSQIMIRDYYSTAPWIWPVIEQSYLPLFGVIVLSLMYTNAPGDYTMTEFWLTKLHFLLYMLVGFPTACAATMIAGLSLDQWYSHQSGWKWNLIFWLGFTHHGIIFVCFDFEPTVSYFIRNSHIAIPGFMYTIYVFCGGLVFLRAEIKRYLLTNKPIS